METKICKICSVEKTILEFHKRKDSDDGFRNECKNCTRLRINNYRRENKEKINSWNRGTYYRNIDKHKETKKKYRDKNNEKQKIRAKKYRENNVEKIKKYHQDNKEYLMKEALQRHNNRYKNDIIFKLKHMVRARLKVFFNSQNITKKNKTFDIVGCTPEQLREHIEKQFKDGMCWEKMGKHIHIDHIIPLASAKTEEEILKLCHYTNLQPLWAEDNLKKGDKIIY